MKNMHNNNKIQSLEQGNHISDLAAMGIRKEEDQK